MRRAPTGGQTQTQTPTEPTPTAPTAPTPTSTAAIPGVPIDLNAIAPSATRLNLPVLQTPASVDVVSQQTIRDQGYRTTAETVNGAVGVLAVDVAGAPANFSMRGFSFGEVNVLYNGISTGPASITSRTMDTATLGQVEFLKGPSALMSGLNAIGGSVNYVSRQPHRGAIQNELDLSVDSLGTVRSHIGSGGSATKDLDYRVDVVGSHINGFIDDVNRNLQAIATQYNYHVTDTFTAWVAAEFKRDDGHAYWGTPLVPIAFAGPFAKGGVVSGSAISTFDGSVIGPVTFDSRLRKTNYNVLDDTTGSHDVWLRGGFDWALANNITVKNQTYSYWAQRWWRDSETYAFNTTTGNTIDRDRFFVGHNQHLIGNNTDVMWDSYFAGMENRLAGQLQVSSNKITFQQHAGGFPEDTVDVINPDRGFYGIFEPDIRNKRLDIASVAVEDRLKVTPWLALIGGVKLEHMTLDSNGVNFDGSIPAGNPFSKSWDPVPYRAAVTIEPIHNLMFYGMTATAYDPAAAGIFSIRPGTSLELTSSKIYEAGVKQQLGNWGEWSVAAYDITRRNVYVQITNAVAVLAGEVDTKGVEFNIGARPIEGLKVWANFAFTQARYKDFDVFTGNTPSNVAPIIINAGASYRWEHFWRWPVEVGASVRHVDRRFLFEDDLTIMQPYTTADVFAFVDIPGRDFGRPELKDVRVAFRVRNVTNTVYAAASDPGYQDQFYLGAPRTYEVATSIKW